MATRHPASLLAWSLWVLWAVSEGLTFWLVRRSPDEPVDHLTGVALVGFATVGALVAARRPRNAVGWLLLGFALAVAVQTGGQAYSWTRSRPGYLAAAWCAEWMQYVGLALIVFFVPLLFPEGRLLSHRWRPVLWLGVTATALGVVGIAFQPHKMEVLPSVDNPLGVDGPAGKIFGALDQLGIVLLGAGVVLTAVSIVLRFRRSRGVERQQVKWFAVAALLMATGWTAGFVDLLLPGDQAVLGSVGWAVFLVAAVAGVPSATSIAIFRYHLYDIGRVVNRTLVYTTLTAALLGTYVVSVLVLRPSLSSLTGDSNVAVAASTLAVAALFRPARARIQKAVDRRFYRSKYDAARTLDDFAARLRHELDLDAVGADLCAAAEETVQPTHVSLWLLR